MQAYPGGIVAGTAGGAVTVLQQAGHGGASSYCGGGGWLTVAEAAADGAVARLAADPTLEHALVSTCACSLWCGPNSGARSRLHCRLLPLMARQLAPCADVVFDDRPLVALRSEEYLLR